MINSKNLSVCIKGYLLRLNKKIKKLIKLRKIEKKIIEKTEP
jgi:hypothetical protein